MSDPQTIMSRTTAPIIVFLLSFFTDLIPQTHGSVPSSEIERDHNCTDGTARWILSLTLKVTL